ncbi:DUF402 domain-containing protein [Solibacillus sp. MA9]|uniref:DUF402 domain-containing protein n=1 Tax=Solibacillus palustris TaxID=2908203 RepID=A0ABS9UGQ0_9BACL|nr:DUF402 domain-containing protein [Solibacillus sp. MA9]MCH7323413.1 DUF402 domain-containing protein [Solibacillus sp. MA9]
MLKKRYLHRNDWSRITCRHYMQQWVEEPDFTGYIALIEMHEVKEPLVTTQAGQELRIVDIDYSWLQQLPMNEHYAVTTMFNAKGEVVQWYIDITNENGVDQGEPYMEDLFLDIIVLPTGEVIKKDEDEIVQALKNEWISDAQYELAYATFYKLLKQIKQGEFNLLASSKKHREYLLQNHPIPKQV